jgi:hypothetical protein
MRDVLAEELARGSLDMEKPRHKRVLLTFWRALNCYSEFSTRAHRRRVERQRLRPL